MRMRRIIFICVACPALSYFSTLSHKLHDFRGEKVTEHKICVLILSTNLSATFYILRRTERDIIKNACLSSCAVPVILVRFYCNFNFHNIFSKNTQIYNFMKICLVGAELLHADARDRQTDRHDEANSGFSKFWKRA